MTERADPKLIARLKEISGDENVFSERSATEDYSHDMADYEAVPMVVVQTAKRGRGGQDSPAGQGEQNSNRGEGRGKQPDRRVVLRGRASSSTCEGWPGS